MNIYESLEKILNNYLTEKRTSFKDNELNKMVTVELPEVLYKELELEKKRYLITGSCGKGNWANIPWIAIFDRTISITATRGYYIVILFREDMSGFYLSLNQGYTWFENNFKKKEAKINVHLMAEKIRQQLELEKTDINLNSNGDLAKGYELGNIYSIFYGKNDERIKNIKNDIWNMLGYFYKAKLIVGDWEEYNKTNLMHKDVSMIEDFKRYYFERKEQIENADFMIERTNSFKEFYKEYPFEDFKELKIEDYVLGNNNTDSLCYKMEYGKFKDCGPGIGGSPATKYGIYYSKEHENYMYSGEVELEPEKQWSIIKEDICKILQDVFESKAIDEIDDDYDSLKGMSMFIIKLTTCYFPQKIIGISGRKHIISLLELFGFNYNDSKSSLKLAILLNNKLREAIPELNMERPEVIAHIIWEYLQEKSKVEVENKNDKYQLDEINSKWNDIQNLIFYGIPGSGKSYYIKNKLLKELNIQEYERVIFYPEYTYSDFVGTYKVTNDKENPIKPVAGPFTRVLIKAIKNKDKNRAIVIEELNRGQAEAIFGDTLQLLDRKDGQSEYSINNDFIKDCMQKEGLTDEEIKLPKNLYIIATVNTSDQNVFSLDTAFGRRWNYERVNDEFSLEQDNDNYSEKLIRGFHNVKWNTFRTSINKAIIDPENNIWNKEDKQLGLFYISNKQLSLEGENTTEDQEARKAFVNKVIRYLWFDVFKNEEERLIATINSTNLVGKEIRQCNSFDELAKQIIEIEELA